MPALKWAEVCRVQSPRFENSNSNDKSLASHSSIRFVNATDKSVKTDVVVVGGG